MRKAGRLVDRTRRKPRANRAQNEAGLCRPAVCRGWATCLCENLTLYRPKKPSVRTVFRRQSSVPSKALLAPPVAVSFVPTGRVWRRTLMVSKGYSTYFPARPAALDRTKASGESALSTSEGAL